MSYASSIVGLGPFKKKTLDYIVPAAVYRLLAGKEINREVVSSTIASLYNSTATPVAVQVAVPQKAPTPTPKPDTTTIQEDTPQVSQVPTSADAPLHAPRVAVTTTSSHMSTLKSQSTLSIAHMMAMQKKDEEKKEENHNRELLKNPFNQSELSRQWVIYASRMKEENHHVLYSAMNDARLTLGEDFNVEIEVTSSVSAGFIEGEMLSIIEFLKTELKNECITHSIKVVSEKKQKLPYTPIEKYQYLLEKNPMLGEMRVKLKLNLDF